MRQIALIVLGSALLLATCVAGRADNLDPYITAQMAEQHITGLSMAVVRDGKIVKARGYGLANIELRVPATPDTLYQIASVTKQFTATGVMMLVEGDKVRLTDRIGTYLDGLPEAWQAVTIRQLLTHTSGIPDFTQTDGFERMSRKDFTHSELLKLLAGAPMDFPPGTKWQYSNTGYFLLGMLIEKVSGQAYGDYLQERIFRPLGMTATRVNDLRAVLPNRATGYEWKDGAFQNAEYTSPTQPFAAGALVSTVTDFAKWDAALYTDRLLRRTSLQEMWTPVTLPGGGNAPYGFGWQVRRVNGHTNYAHSGGITGFSSDISRFPDDHLTVIVLANGKGHMEPLAQGIARRCLPGLTPPAPKSVRIAPSTLESYTGYYDVQGQMASITLRDGKLYAKMGQPALLELLPVSPDTFCIADTDLDPERSVRIRFVPDAQSETRRFVYSSDTVKNGVSVFLSRRLSALTPRPDPDPVLTQQVGETLRALSLGDRTVAESARLTPGARAVFSEHPEPALVGYRSLLFLAARTLPDGELMRHGGKVARVVSYKLLIGTSPRLVLVYLTADGLVTDEDVLND